MAKVKTPTFQIQTLSQLGEIQFITSGIKEIDAVTKLPKGRITEIFGMQGVGKSDLMLTCVSAMSKEGKVLYIDAENAINPQRFIDKGGVPENISVSNEHILEDVANFVSQQLNKYDVIVIDSVASLVPRAESEGQTGDQFVGLRARLMGQWMRRLVAPLGKSKCAMVFINQLRDSMVLYGDSQFTPGGKALPYAASLRLKLSTNRADRVAKDGTTIGHFVTVEVVKSRVCPPHQKARFKLLY